VSFRPSCHSISCIGANNFHAAPLIVVFTKYDTLVTSLIEQADEAIFEQEDEEIWSYGEGKALTAFNELCTNSLIKVGPGVPITKVSSEYTLRTIVKQK
jgi:hypothetical protein